MPKTKIGKEVILDAALNIIRKNGYGGLNIGQLAKELNSSTQPISWHFENMDGLRRELLEYTTSYANQKMQPNGGTGLEQFGYVGEGYINLAFDEPNIFRYLYLGEGGNYCFGGLDEIKNDSGNEDIIQLLSSELQIAKVDAGNFVQSMIIYTHGLAAFVAAGVTSSTRQEVLAKMTNAQDAFLMQFYGAGG